jgi:hypothetical protein
MPYSQAWLEDNSAHRCILAIVSVYDVLAGVEISLYLSTRGYSTDDGNTLFLPVISGSPNFYESMSIEGGVSSSYGDLEIVNTDGSRDTWLDPAKYIWVNRPITIYYGDPSFFTTTLTDITGGANFEVIFAGVVTDITSTNRDVLNIVIGDKMSQLNFPVSDVAIGTYGTWASGQPNEDDLKPLVIGEVFNVTPILVDPATLEYMVNLDAVNSIHEVRDNGVPVSIVGTPTTGKFKLVAPIVGTCTVSVQGIKKNISLTTGAYTAAYSNTIPNHIAVLTSQYGKSANRLDPVTEIDLVNFNDFKNNNLNALVGYYLSDRDNLLAVCNNIAASVNAQMFFTRKGKLRLIQVGVPTAEASVTITNTDIIQGTLSILSRTTVIAATKIGFCKNWTVQDNLTTSIPTSSKDIFSNEYYTSFVTDSTVATRYNLTEAPIRKDTYLITGAGALAEATRLNNYFKVPRTVYGFTGTAKLLSLQLGQEVNLVHNRFGLDAGKSGQVVSLKPDWLRGLVDIEVLI